MTRAGAGPLVVVVVAAALTGCTPEPAPPRGAPASPGPARTPVSVTPSVTPSPAAPSPAAGGPRATAMVASVRVLAGRIGPREATSAAYRRAARWVQGQLASQGYDVTAQRFPVPAGTSWGVAVPRGRSRNVIATPPGFDPARPHLLVGAHLDTVPQAPGAEDNASGVAVLLELARLAADPAGPGTRRPVVFIAFGAEEPRGPGDALHHFGSRHHVASLGPAARRSVRAMVSLDRVGTGRVVPVCTGGLSPPRVRAALRAAAARAGVPTSACGDNRSSDHWSYEKAGVAVARVGSTPYPQYHSARDRPSVVRPVALQRTAQVLWTWLRRD